MNKLLFLFYFFLLHLMVFSQTKPFKNSSKPKQEKTVFNEVNQQENIEGKVYSFVEQSPTFPGGEDSLMVFIRKNLIYKKESKKSDIPARIIVSFIVAKDGTVRDAQIKRGYNESYNQAALNMMSKMPKWIPGQQNGKPVNVFYNLPISFKQ